MNEIMMQKMLEVQAQRIEALEKLVDSLTEQNNSLKEMCKVQQQLNDRQQALLDELTQSES